MYCESGAWGSEGTGRGGAWGAREGGGHVTLTLLLCLLQFSHIMTLAPPSLLSSSQISPLLFSYPSHTHLSISLSSIHISPFTSSFPFTCFVSSSSNPPIFRPSILLCNTCTFKSYYVQCFKLHHLIISQTLNPSLLYSEIWNYSLLF